MSCGKVSNLLWVFLIVLILSVLSYGKFKLGHINMSTYIFINFYQILISKKKMLKKIEFIV